MAHDAQQAMFDARDYLMDIVDFTNIDVAIHSFVGYAGCSTHEQIVTHLKRKKIREITHNDFDAVFIAENYDRLGELEQEFSDLFTVVSEDKIADLLQTKTGMFSAALACKK